MATPTRLGPYEVLSPIGSGGMGEVFKARDTRLDRLVAIKMIRPELGDTPDAVARFEREGRAIARLAHPNICALYDVGEADHVRYLVMELLHGETLSARIARGALPLPQVLGYGVEIARALAAAHHHGIVHRDLKPGNVMLTATGVKLLDFGLANALAPLPLTSEPEEPATRTAAARLTTAGAIMGTAPYMAPEQINGRAADARTDVFALGAVLYEMATGQRAFGGDSHSAITASVLHHDPPPISSTRAGLPPALDRLVRECLAKDPEGRWHSAHDVALQLAAIAEDPARVAEAVRARPARFPWLVAAAAMIAALVSSWMLLSRPTPSADRVELQLAPPPESTFFGSIEAVSFAVSPDGTRLAFIAPDAGGIRHIWVRPLTSTQARQIDRTDQATSVFWSPDGHAIAFVANGSMRRVDLASGAPVPICDVVKGQGISGSWNAAGDILFAPVEGTAIYRVATSGGTPAVVVPVNASKDEVRVLFPSYLPDGRRFLYLVRYKDSSGWLMLAEPGREPKRLMPMESNAALLDADHVLFVQGGTLLAQRIDLAAFTVVGDPISVADSVKFFLTTGVAAFAASSSGTVVYQSQSNQQRIAWFDRTGRELEPTGATPGEYLDVRLTNSGHTALLSRALPATGTWDVWSLDLDRHTETRVTTDDRFTEIGPVPSPDGRTLIYAAARGGAPHLVRRDVATGSEAPIGGGRQFQEVQDISPDGRVLAYSERAAAGQFNLWTVPLDGSGAPSPFRQSQANESGLRFSPDSRDVIFISSESGPPQVYLAARSGGPSTAVSTEGAVTARWGADGREIVYLTSDRRVIAVPVKPVLGRPETLFALTSRRWISFDLTRDGKKLLAIVPHTLSDEQPLTAILNWKGRVR